ncbi:MAG: hypothetical protein AB1716_13825, partial [Planctomycetota bacterium]
MVVWVLRILFVVLIWAVALLTAGNVGAFSASRTWLWMIGAVLVALILIGIDIFLPRKSLAALSGAFLGLVVGMVFAYGLGLIIDLMVEVYFPGLSPSGVGVTRPPAEGAGAGLSAPAQADPLVSPIKLMVGLIS